MQFVDRLYEVVTAGGGLVVQLVGVSPSRWVSASSVARYGQVVHLQLGRHGFDVTTRGLVIASISATDLTSSVVPVAVHELIAEYPAMVEVIGADIASAAPAIERVAELFTGPISLRTSRSDITTVAVRAGAVALQNHDGLADPAYVRAVEPVNVALIISAPTGVGDERSFLVERGRWAEAAGIDRTRLVLAASADAVEALHELGYITMVEPAADPSAQGANAVAMSNGARLFSTTQVRATRRTIDTVSELLERRETVEAI